MGDRRERETQANGQRLILGVVLKLLLLFSLGYIVWQDIKERRVYWFLFPLVGVFCAILHYKNTLPELFLIAVSVNVVFVLVLIAVIFLYARLKMKAKINDVFGWGDAFLFIGLAFSFSTISFIIIFISALIFSLVVHLFLKKDKHETIPLAGYMCVFFGIAYLSHWSGLIDSVYII